MHEHISFIGFLITGCYLVIFSFFWRMAAAHFSEKPLGKAMAVIL